MWWDVLIEPAIQDHVTDGGAHGRQVEEEKWKVVKPSRNISISKYEWIHFEIRIYFVKGWLSTAPHVFLRDQVVKCISSSKLQNCNSKYFLCLKNFLICKLHIYNNLYRSSGTIHCVSNSLHMLWAVYTAYTDWRWYRERYCNQE